MISFVRKWLLHSRRRRVADSGDKSSAACPAYEAPPSASFSNLRSMGRAAADFAADYYEALLAGHLPVMSQAQPGFLRRALPAAAPEQAESGEAVLQDVKALILPGLTHWQHPRFFAYFPCCAACRQS
jgi:hypothetical protein